MKSLAQLMFAVLLTPVLAIAADPWGLEKGTPELKSAGSLAFGPDDVLFVGDTKSATVFAIATGDVHDQTADADISITNIDQAIADVCGEGASINDLATNPRTGTTFLSVTTSDGPAICQVDAAGKLTQLSLTDVAYAKAVLPDAPEDKVVQQGRRKRNPREDAITDIAFYEDRILVSGLRAGDAPSSVREFSFPFSSIDKGTGIAIYHAAHGREEDYAAARTFVTLMIDGEPNLLAAYTCTPLVKIPLDDLREASQSVQGTTVAELGNRNRPLDMISYTKSGAGYLLLSNSNRGVMKITTSGLSNSDGLSEPVKGGGTAGQAFETIASLDGVLQMDKLSEDHAVVLIETDGGINLKTVALP